MARALEKHLGPIEHLGPLSAPLMPLVKTYGKLVQFATGKRYLALQSSIVARQLSRDAARKIRAASPDVIVAPAGSILIGNIPSNVLIVYSSDATARLIDGYHPNYRNIAAGSRSDAEMLEQAAIKRADLLLYPTEWVARSAIGDYGADPGKTHVVEYGANIIDWPGREEALQVRSDGTCRLLFVGVDWKEKGAAIALDALRALRARNIMAELTVCGCEPDRPVDAEGLTIVPFLDKNDPQQLSKLVDLYRNADFFLLPTRADCYGIAYCEAAAYGVPSIGTATGGVPDVVREGENGHLLPIDADGAAYARLIEEIHEDRDRYRRLRAGSRDNFETRLNWDVWGRKTARLVTDLVSSRRRQAPVQAVGNSRADV